MGLWDQFVVLPASAAGLPPELRVLSNHDGWQYVRLPDDVDTGETVSNLATTHAVPVIGAYVWDSDTAAVSFSAPSGEGAWLAINEAYDDEYEAMTGHTARWTSPELQREAAEALARWASEYAPRKAGAAEIVAGLADLVDDEFSQMGDVPVPTIVMAEDGLRFVLEDMLGFANLDDAVFIIE